MSGFLDDREHAAENLFAHNEELLFLAHRAGVRDLALWAADAMDLEPVQRDTYAVKLIDALVSGVGDEAILTIVQKDLEGAARAEAARKAAGVLTQAVARAAGELSGRTVPPPLGRPAAEAHTTRPIGASLSWRD